MPIFSCTNFTSTTIFCSVTSHTFTTLFYFFISFIFSSFLSFFRFLILSFCFCCEIIIFFFFCFPFWYKCWIFFSTSNTEILFDVFGFFFRYMDAVTVIPKNKDLINGFLSKTTLDIPFFTSITSYHKPGWIRWSANTIGLITLF